MHAGPSRDRACLSEHLCLTSRWERIQAPVWPFTHEKNPSVSMSNNYSQPHRLHIVYSIPIQLSWIIQPHRQYEKCWQIYSQDITKTQSRITLMEYGNMNNISNSAWQLNYVQIMKCWQIYLQLLKHNQELLKYEHHMNNRRTTTFSTSVFSFISFSRRLRYLAYRQFVRWCWGLLGRKIRVVIPACVVLRIRATYPDDEGFYTGFRLPNV